MHQGVGNITSLCVNVHLTSVLGAIHPFWGAIKPFHTVTSLQKALPANTREKVNG